MTNKTESLVFILLHLVCYGYAQVQVPVDLHSGRASIAIPLHQFNVGELIVPVALTYDARGVRFNQDDGDYEIGVGWELAAGGSITREVKGLPDDKKPLGTDQRQGWLYGNGGNVVTNFAVQPSTDCLGSNDNFYYIAGIPVNIDTEPDVFSFSAPGISGKFIFDNNKTVRTIPYQDVQISPTYAESGKIISIQITASNGYRYVFSSVATVEAVKNTLNYDASSFADWRQKYDTSISFTGEWGLTMIFPPAGDNIAFYYDHDENYDVVSKSVINGVSFTSRKKLMNSLQVGSDRLEINLHGINGFFPYPGVGADRDKLFKIYYGEELLKTIVVDRDNIGGKTYLKSLYEQSECLKTPPYVFEYIGVEGTNSVMTSSYSSNEEDYWGYFNDNNAPAGLNVPILHVYPDEPMEERYRLYKIEGYTGNYFVLDQQPAYIGTSFADRAPNEDAVTASSLYKVTFPTGGSVKLDYESNEFFDPKANAVYKGGGIRVKQITYHDGIDHANNIVTQYTYSGGKLVNRPQFARPTHLYGGQTIENFSGRSLQDRYRFFTYMSAYDLNAYSFDDPNVVYESAEEIQPGKGKTVYTFSLPATFGAHTSPEYSSPNNWEATHTRIAVSEGPGGCASKGLFADGYNTFPFAPNTNYGFERGLLTNVKTYNESGQLLKEKAFLYAPVYQETSPNLIYGLAVSDFRFPNGPVVYAFSKYKLLAGMDKLLIKETEIVSDPTQLSRKSTTETHYAYESANHYLPSSISTAVSADGVSPTSYKTTFKYPADYSFVGTPVGAAAIAIDDLKAKHINNVVIEKSTYIQKPGDIFKLTSSELNTFQVFGYNRAMPAEKYNFLSNVPVSNFQVSAIQSDAFVRDNRYRLSGKVLDYTYEGKIYSMEDREGYVQSYHYDVYSRHQILQIANASVKEVAYSSFDYEAPPADGFAQAYAPNDYLSFMLIPGKVGNAATIGVDFHLFKESILAGERNYALLSCWLRSGVAGTMTLTLTGVNNAVVTQTFSYSNSNGEWLPVKMRVPVTGLGTSFSARIDFTNQLDIDELLFKPEHVLTSSQAYRQNLKVRETDIRGDSRYYEYDALGRLLIVRDKDQNIIRRQQYNYQDNINLNASFSITSHTNSNKLPLNQAIQFNIGNSGPCELTGISRTWDFGDGTIITNGGPTPSHTYTTEGTYTVKLTVSHPDYGEVTRNQQVTVVNTQPFAFYICVGGITEYGIASHTIADVGDCGMLPLGTNTFEAMITSGCGNPDDYSYTWSKSEGIGGNGNWEIFSEKTKKITLYTPLDANGNIASQEFFTIRCSITALCTETVSTEYTYIVFY